MAGFVLPLLFSSANLSKVKNKKKKHANTGLRGHMSTIACPGVYIRIPTFYTLFQQLLLESLFLD